MNARNALLQTLLLSFSFLGYGPVQDHSEFVSEQVGEKVADQWNYRPLEIKLGTLK